MLYLFTGDSSSGGGGAIWLESSVIALLLIVLATFARLIIGLVKQMVSALLKLSENNSQQSDKIVEQLKEIVKESKEQRILLEKTYSVVFNNANERAQRNRFLSIKDTSKVEKKI